MDNNPKPLSRTFRLFTEGSEPAIDALAIIMELLKELPENERLADIGYVADYFGFKLYRK